MKKKQILISALAIVFFSINSSAQTDQSNREKVWQELLAFKNQDLFEESSYENRKKADDLLGRLVFDEETRQERKNFHFWSVRYLWETGANRAKPNYAAMESPLLILLPGQQTHHFYFIDKDGKLLKKEDFSTGWRMMVGKVELVKNKDFDFPLVKISAAGGGSFAYAQTMTQYYALLDESVVLVRIESRTISSLNLDNRNAYGCRYPSIGPPMPVRTAEEWAGSLNAEDPAEILRTLMWLAGKHENLEDLREKQKYEENLREKEPEREKWPTTLEKCPQIVEDIKIYESVKKREDVQKRLLELAGSPSQWIKESAELALKPIAERKRDKK